MSKGALGWFNDVSTYSAKVIECWTKISQKFYLNKKVKGKFGHILGIVEKPLMREII